MQVLDQFVVPPGDPERGAAAAVALGRAGLASDAGRQVLEDDAVGALVTSQSWQGEAATAYRERCLPLARRLTELDRTCAAAAELVRSWVTAAVPAMTTMRRARADIEARLAVAQPGLPGMVDAQLSSSMTAFRAARHDYDRATAAAAQGLWAVRDGIDDRSLTAGDQVLGFVGALWNDAVAAPMAAAFDRSRTIWGLTGAALVDPEGFRGNVAAVPGQVTSAFRTVEQVLADPVPVVRSAVGAAVGEPDFERGRWGAGAGTLTAIAVPVPKGAKVTRALEVAALRDAGKVAAALPRLQTMDQLLTKVDLSTNELAGHTLERHVSADDAYLADRMRLGTLMPDGARGFVPPSASRFQDEATAQRVVDQVLHENDAAVRHWAAGKEDRVELVRDLGSPIGTVCELVDGRPVFSPGSVAKVRLRKTADGQVYLDTAFVDLGAGGRS